MARPKDPVKKQLILDKALGLIAERGYHAVSVKDIATEAGISLGSMYTYFESKETLVNELFRYWKNMMFEALSVGDDGIYPGGWSNRVYDRDLESRHYHRQLCRRMGRFMREHTQAFLFLETQLHADYLDQESVALEHQATQWALDFYRDKLQVDTFCSAPQDLQILLSASFGTFVQVFKAFRVGLLAMDDGQMDVLESLLWDMIQGFKGRFSSSQGSTIAKEGYNLGSTYGKEPLAPIMQET